MNVRLGIAASRRGRDDLRVGSLVMRCRTNDRVKGWRQRADDFVGPFVTRRAGDENPAVATMNRHEACKRLPDAVRGVADIDHGERVVLDDFEPARPARLAQSAAYRGFDPVGRLARLLAL